jgi:Reverse transcriptase (RNA-dependent DNA polymerase)
MLNACHLPIHLREQLWDHTAHLATLLDIILVTNHKDKSPYELWYNKIPPWSSNFRTFGEIGIIQDSALRKIKSKLTNRGFPAMFIGYPPNHSNDVFQFMVLSKWSIITSHNVVWLNTTYGNFMQIPVSERSLFIDPIPEDNTSDLDDDVDLGIEILRGVRDNQVYQCTRCGRSGHVAANCFQLRSASNANDTDNDDPPLTPIRHQPPVIPLPPLPVSDDDTDGPADSISAHDDTDTDSTASFIPRVSGVHRLHHNLTTFYNPDPALHADIEDANFALMTSLSEQHYALDSLGSIDYNPAPTTYRDAMGWKDKSQWKASMHVEFENMHDKHIRRIVKRADIPTGRKLIGNRWVYALTDDGTYRARTVGQGFSQIPGKDFHENHAPVVHDTTFRFRLVQMLIHKLSSAQFDVVTAFLYGALDEIIYMAFPDGYSQFLQEKFQFVYSSTEYCLRLEKALYGLVQAARQWWKRMNDFMKKLGFFPSPTDPCSFVKAGTKHESPAFIIVYVDDGLIIRTPDLIKTVIKALAKEFKIKDLGPIKKFVGCQILINRARDTIWINQPKLIQNLELNFRTLVTTERLFKTPAAPRSVVMRPVKYVYPTIHPDRQFKYRSGVGMLMYLVKHSRPDIANATRELTKVLDGATEAHLKAMMRIIKFFLILNSTH